MPLAVILMSAIWTAITYIFKAVIIKFVVFFAIFYVLSEFIPIMFSLFHADIGLVSTYAQAIPATVWYFFDAFNLPNGIPFIISAYMSRFAIRRIPFIG